MGSQFSIITHVGGGADLHPEASSASTGRQHKFQPSQPCKCLPDSWSLVIKGAVAASAMYYSSLTVWMGCTSSAHCRARLGPTPPPFSLCLHTSDDTESSRCCFIGSSLEMSLFVTSPHYGFPSGTTEWARLTLHTSLRPVLLLIHICPNLQNPHNTSHLCLSFV